LQIGPHRDFVRMLGQPWSLRRADVFDARRTIGRVKDPQHVPLRSRLGEMTSVILEGWKTALRSVLPCRLLQARAVVGLQDAQQCLDRRVNAEPARIDLPIAGVSDVPVRTVCDLGAVTTLERAAKQRTSA
jgi:hypothetical protein